MGKAKKINPQEMPYADCTEQPTYPEGLKWTRQRKEVYRVLWESEEPLTAGQVYRRILEKEDGGTYAVSTVYRILAAFAEQGLIEQSTWMADGNGHAPGADGAAERGHLTMRYELKRQGHTHYAVCLECHRRIPLKSCPFAHISLGKETEDFRVTSHKLELYGYCRDCREGKKIGNFDGEDCV